MTIEHTYILLGSNLGDREAYIAHAVNRLEKVQGLRIIARSSVYESDAQDVVGQHPPFLNQVVKVHCALSPDDLLRQTERIEAKLGRTGKEQRKPRTIDIDLLYVGRTVVNNPRLTLPHPGILDRPFVMVPLVELEPDITDPVSGRPVSDFLLGSERTNIQPYTSHALETG